MRKPTDLVRLCIEYEKSFKPAVTTLDVHLSECLEQGRITDDNDAVFIKQVVYGLQRYKKLIKVIN